MKKGLLVIGVAVVLLAVYLLQPGEDVLQPGETVQNGRIEVSNSTSYQHDITYSQIFTSLPRIKVKLITGSGYLEIVEQRVDGFIFKTSHLGYAEAKGAYVEWTAAGFIENN